MNKNNFLKWCLILCLTLASVLIMTCNKAEAAVESLPLYYQWRTGNPANGHFQALYAGTDQLLVQYKENNNNVITYRNDYITKNLIGLEVDAKKIK